ncbi:RluA family pseudouridine synthase [Faecalibaculum rodentium]|uniref:RluA family pseudouridine synthase n=1 Tax=Faecalibaculum rodentium TaxID=1702221 RepID=UPI0023EFFCCE|nr:RluA family pseudouridine synthase [Faecalibaculum rodentium]
MEHNIQVQTLPSGDLQVRLEEPMTGAQLVEKLGISREKDKTLEILENGQSVANRGRMLESRVVTLRQPVPEEIPYSFEPVDVIYEDQWCLVVNKPAFLLVHDDGQTPDNLTSRVNAHLAESGWPYPAQAVNRIDREASGLVLFCKNPLFQNWFDRQMEDRTTQKEYYAVLEGLLERRHVDLNNPIGRNRHEADKMIVYPKGKASHTHLERIARRGTRTLVKAWITTGRKHQIRVHAAHQGHAVVNDALYGEKADERGLLLQSARIVFRQPVTNQQIEVEIPMDPRFREFRKPPRRPRKGTTHRR